METRSAFYPQILIPSAHKIVVNVSNQFGTAPTTFVQVFVGMTDHQFHCSSGADRENCKEMFSVELAKDGKYKVRHLVTSDRGRKFRNFTGKSDKVDQALQQFIDSL